jgi:hypothetical protein
MEDLGVERVHGRPIRLFQLARWEWIEPGISPFTLLVVACASDDEIFEDQIRRFASDAVASGMRLGEYVGRAVRAGSRPVRPGGARG